VRGDQRTEAGLQLIVARKPTRIDHPPTVVEDRIRTTASGLHVDTNAGGGQIEPCLESEEHSAVLGLGGRIAAWGRIARGEVMAENESVTAAPITPYLYYEDVAAAPEWLSRAFGFHERENETMRSPEGRVVHSAMELGRGVILLGCPGADYECPKRHGYVTQNLYVYVDDVELHFEQAQASGADVVGLANAGSDTTNAITTASEFGVTQAGQTLAALLLFLTDVHALGANTAQGIQLTTGWYWDMNDEPREWSDRFMKETGVRPTMVHAGIYSSTLQYLNAVAATGSDNAQAVRKQMMDTPINDMFAKNGRIREDGRMVHDMYLAEVKTPAESKNEWDLYRILRTIPADEAYRPLSESKCKLVNN